MKKFLWVVLTIIALGVAVVFLLPKLVPMERLAAKVKERVKMATGRDMDFRDVELVFWPDLGIKMSAVTLSNPVWAKDKNMLTLESVNIALALKPLLNKQVEIKFFLLEAPVIHLEVGANGKNNWDFSKEAPAAELEESKAATTKSSSMASGFSFKFGPSQISNGKLSFIDAQKDGSYQIHDINLSATFPDLKSPLKLKGSLTYRKKRVDIAIDILQPAGFMHGGASPGHADIKTSDFSVKAAGALAMQGELFNGHVETEVTSLSALLAWLGDGKEAALPFQKVSFTSALRASNTDLILKGADLMLDGVNAKGNMNIGFAGKPEIFARLSLNKLNLDRFIGVKDEGAAGASVAGKKEAADDGWDSKPIDLSGLKSINADLELKTEGFSVKGVDVGASVLTVTLQDKNLHFKSSEASLLGGKFSSNLNLNAAPAVPTMSFTFNMSDVQAKPVLTSFANFKKLSGAVDANVAVTSSGNSQKALISNLKGDGSVIFKKGSLEGIDLVNIAQLVQKRLSDMSVGEGKTDFVELGGKFTIDDGIVSNNDLKMRGPLLQATGKGTISLPQKFIQYRVIPVLTASSATEGAAGIAVPVDIKGPFSHIKIKPDFASVVRHAIENPDNVKQTVKGIKNQIKTLKQNPMDTLRNLFGGEGGLFGKPAASTPSPAPAQ